MYIPISILTAGIILNSILLDDPLEACGIKTSLYIRSWTFSDYVHIYGCSFFSGRNYIVSTIYKCIGTMKIENGAWLSLAFCVHSVIVIIL